MAFLKVETRFLFPTLRRALLELLDGLDEDEWELPTACEAWSVKDVGLHLLGVEISNISRHRDGVRSGPREGQDLAEWLNEDNETWVRATRAISPTLLIGLLEHCGREFESYLAGVDEDAVTAHVSWAGDDLVPVWLDIAREYTERWVHQQQMRDATNRPGLKDEEFLRPVLETFIHALPVAYQQTEAVEGSVVEVRVNDLDVMWHIERLSSRWDLKRGGHPDPTARVNLDGDGAWRLFTRNPDAPVPQTEGDEGLARQVANAVAIVA